MVAVLAAESGDPHRSALLVGASDQFRSDRRIRSLPKFKHAHALVVDRLGTGYQPAHDAGAAISQQQVVILAASVVP